MSEVATTVATIGQRLHARIIAGEFTANGRLPSERTLSEQFSTTRITLQEALGQLEIQGVIYRQMRRGWFISPPRLRYNPLERSHFHAMAEQQGRQAATSVIDASTITASNLIAKRLELPEAAPVYRIRRLRHIDGRAVLYCEHYLNPAFFCGILQADLTQSLTTMYAERFGIDYGRVRFDMLPTLLTQEAASALKVASGSPALFITRINRDQHDRVIDCDLEYWRYDALHIDVEAVG
ncbi:UTRA domain-containing protein [Serratia aquatilis]|uniref:UTRA domain-containing protein n=1 Tax=Serratia aquatilis TaxID=1737515 RepID=A0ABV6EGB0_9GAMM